MPQKILTRATRRTKYKYRKYTQPGHEVESIRIIARLLTVLGKKLHFELAEELYRDFLSVFHISLSLVIL